MKITIDTQHDSKEDIIKAIELLRNLTNHEHKSNSNIFENNSQPTDMFNMFNSTEQPQKTEPEEQKEESQGLIFLD